MLNGKKVLLGITASIAAYKSASIVRLLKKSGAQVKVIQTAESTNFITPLTLSTLSENDVLLDLIDSDTNTWNNHVELSIWADLMLIAPLTAKSMSKMVQGNCDNLLLATYLSAKCPVYFAPAMDLDMYKHPSTVDNINKLISFSNVHIPAKYGFLASGLEGEGRMCEPEEIISFIKLDLEDKLSLKGKKLLITSGPTREAIDKVRYISNHSSGKMGFALARAAKEAGAQTILIAGPVNLATPSGVERRDVTTALDMLAAAETAALGADLFIGAAAVADFRPANIAEQKIKKQSGDPFTLQLIQNPDIIAQIASLPAAPTLMVGFAAETEQVESHAASKRIRKGLDVIVANDVSRSDIGFNSDQNTVTVIDSQGARTLPTASKQQLALWLIEVFADRLTEKCEQSEQQGGRP